ncbi:hypothetical protein Tco_1340790 [Tanacetum coccineum]
MVEKVERDCWQGRHLELFSSQSGGSTVTSKQEHLLMDELAPQLLFKLLRFSSTELQKFLNWLEMPTRISRRRGLIQVTCSSILGDK